MKVTHEERRLKAVKEKSFIFGRICTCCQAKVRKEKMWAVQVRPRNVKQDYPDDLYFCKECAPTAQDVLEEIGSRDIYGVEWPKY